MTDSERLKKSWPLSHSAVLVILLALLFLFDRGEHLLYGGLCFFLLALYHLLTDHRHSPEEIRAAGLIYPHIGVYLLLCSLVIWTTTGADESPYWIVYSIPITVAATNLGLLPTLATSGVSFGLFGALTYSQLSPEQRSKEFPELFIFGLMLFTVGVLTQTFSEQNRRQLAQQRALNEKLLEQQEALKESLTRLERAEESLRRKERLAALGEMSAGIAHGIRNPLGIISSSAQLLGGQFPEPATGVRQLLDIIQEETTRLNGLISDFLTFGRPARPALRRLDMGAEARKAVEHVEGMAREKAIRLVGELPETPLPVLADADMLQQVLLNLLLNALEASRPGGTVTLRLYPAGGGLCLEVHDRGCGIPPENLSKIFNPFFTTREKGTGLGLANAHRIVEMHGGSLTVSSSPEAGTTFRLSLPRQES